MHQTQSQLWCVVFSCTQVDIEYDGIKVNSNLGADVLEIIALKLYFTDGFPRCYARSDTMPSGKAVVVMRPLVVCSGRHIPRGSHLPAVLSLVRVTLRLAVAAYLGAVTVLWNLPSHPCLSPRVSGYAPCDLTCPVLVKTMKNAGPGLWQRLCCCNPLPPFNRCCGR